MRLTHDSRKEIVETKKSNGFGTAAILISGLAISGIAAQKSPAVGTNSTRTAYHTTYEMVRAGDTLQSCDSLDGMKVAKIDDKGVVFSSCEGKDTLRVFYGKELRIGEAVLTAVFNVKKGSKPGTAYVEIGNPVAERLAPVQDTSIYTTVPSTGLGMVTLHKAGKPVKAGDVLGQIEFVFEQAGFIGWKVSKIDNKGVELVFNSEMFMSEHTSGTFRLEYGKEHSESWLTFLATKGPKPGTAYVGMKSIVVDDTGAVAKMMPHFDLSK